MFGLIERNKMLLAENNELKLRFEEFTQKLQTLLDEFGAISSSYQFVDYMSEQRLEEGDYNDSTVMYPCDDPLNQSQQDEGRGHFSIAPNKNSDSLKENLMSFMTEEEEDESETESGLHANPTDLEYDPGSYYWKKQSNKAMESEEKDDSSKEKRVTVTITPANMETNSITITPVTPTLSTADAQAEAFDCLMCPFTCEAKHILDQHILKVHNNKFTCNQCEYVGANKQALSHHQSSAHKIVSYQCNYCDFTCTQIINLKRHKRIHLGEESSKNPLSCGLCNFVANNENRLARHRTRVHMNGKYRCKVCMYSFNCKKTLRAHMSLHHRRKHKKPSHQTLSPCDMCDYVGNSKQALDYHYQAKHSGVEYPCTMCDYVGTTKITLRSHMMKKHGTHGLPDDIEPRLQSDSQQLSSLSVENGAGKVSEISTEVSENDGGVQAVEVGGISSVFIKMEPGGGEIE